MWIKWFPWKFIVRYVARAHGFLDPITVLSYLRRFSQPSEVKEPIELLRAGVVFHARGLVNSRAIQTNLDWIWPYWVERQFDPRDKSFIPRAFSLTHINLTHRNWTAVGVPDCPELPIVDPRGLLTPFFDGWSLDGWILRPDGKILAPSQSIDAVQRLDYAGNDLCIVTDTKKEGMALRSVSRVKVENHAAICELALEGLSETGGWLIFALRPYNPEGVNFIHRIVLAQDRTSCLVDGSRHVMFHEPIERSMMSQYHAGDAAFHLLSEGESEQTTDDVGMATAAAMYRLEPGIARTIRAQMRLDDEGRTLEVPFRSQQEGWSAELAGTAALDIPNENFMFLYDAAIRTLILHSPGEVYPGPYTYKRFWFRDAAFIIHAMLCAGLARRSERALLRFPAQQTLAGYFHSQEGEWDSNGQVLWIVRRWQEMTRGKLPHGWESVIRKGAQWIINKRLPIGKTTCHEHGGLLPAGFSAEHLGPNDYYYWDDFWGVAGLRAAASISRSQGDNSEAEEYEKQANDFMKAIEESLAEQARRIDRPAMPSSPHRRLDSGSIGSIVAGYPLCLYPPDENRLMDTIRFLLENCMVHGGFFQDMIHSGVNAYLTLHIAQVLMRAGDLRFMALVRAVADIASPTGQWPEAVHPTTLGGCMGDGQHAWAAAEWIMMMRNCFVYEDPFFQRLVIGAGIVPEWLQTGKEISFGPALTTWGIVRVTMRKDLDGIHVAWNPQWHEGIAPQIEVRFPDHPSILVPAGENQVVIC